MNPNLTPKQEMVIGAISILLVLLFLFLVNIVADKVNPINANPANSAVERNP